MSERHISPNPQDDAPHYSTSSNYKSHRPRRRSSALSAASASEKDGGIRNGLLNQEDDVTLGRNSFELTEDAKAGADLEKRMGFWESARLYPLGVFFSFGLSLAVIMEGYDTQLLGSLWAQPAFAQKYGQPTKIVKGVQQYEVSADWQNIFVLGAIPTVIGLLVNGIVSERFGYRITMMCSLVCITCTLFITFFASNIQVLLVGYLFSSFPWGIFQTITTTYAAEVTPISLRPYLTTYVNLCWVIGQLLASGVLKAVLNLNNQWAYRLPFALQWVWPGPIFIICWFAPESPWWLIRHGKIADARKALLKLTSKNNTSFNVEDTLAMMQHTIEIESYQNTGTSYADCFKGIDLRRTELTIMTWLVQMTCGSPMIGWGTYFMAKVGLSNSNAYSLGVAQSGMGFVGTIASWFLMPHIGRRSLYLWGQIIMLFGLLLIGLLGLYPITTTTGWSIGACMLLLTFVYDITVGPVCYCLVSELPSTKLRIKSVSLSRGTYNLVGMFVGILQARFMNPTAWDLGAKTAFFWAGCNVLGLVWTYYRLPEPKGLTYAEMDILFENQVSAREFRNVDIAPYRSEHQLVVRGESEMSTLSSFKSKPGSWYTSIFNRGSAASRGRKDSIEGSRLLS